MLVNRILISNFFASGGYVRSFKLCALSNIKRPAPVVGSRPYILAGGGPEVALGYHMFSRFSPL